MFLVCFSGNLRSAMEERLLPNSVAIENVIYANSLRIKIKSTVKTSQIKD